MIFGLVRLFLSATGNNEMSISIIMFCMQGSFITPFLQASTNTVESTNKGHFGTNINSSAPV